MKMARQAWALAFTFERMENEAAYPTELPSESGDSRRRASRTLHDATKAESWLKDERPRSLRELTRAIAGSYATVENSSPPGKVIGPVSIAALAAHHPLRQLWPDPSISVRELMFRGTHLYRSLGVLVAEAGSDISWSMPVLGRTLLEVVSQVDWLLEPVNVLDCDSAAGRVIARRTFLLSLAGLVGLQRESEDFDIPDLEQLTALVAAGKERGAALFGRDAVSLSQRNPDRWTIDGEGRPRKGQLVDTVGKKIFSLNVHKSSHYRTPSSSAHGSLGALLGKPIPSSDNIHTTFCLDVDTVEKWLWYYTVWYRYGVDLIARAHRWPDGRIAEYDQDAQALFGRNVYVQR